MTVTPTPAPDDIEGLIEQFVQMMLRASIATGHGDTFEGLLAETEAHVHSQAARIKELEAERDEARAILATWDTPTHMNLVDLTQAVSRRVHDLEAINQANKTYIEDPQEELARAAECEDDHL